MRPPGFFDLEERFAKLDGLGDPLVKVAQVVHWEGFRSVLNRAFAKARKSHAGRKEYCCIPRSFVTDFSIYS